MRRISLISIPLFLLAVAGVLAYRYPHAAALLADQRYLQSVLCLAIAFITGAMGLYSLGRKG